MTSSRSSAADPRPEAADAPLWPDRAPGGGASGSVGVPAPPPRDTRLDLVRGWLQLSIFASHVQGSFTATWLIHAAWGVSDSSEQFVFLSGLVLGSVFARYQVRDGWARAARDMLGHAARLWRTHLVTAVLFGALVVLADRAGLRGVVESYGWDHLLQDPRRAVPELAAMLYQPVYLDALPVFVWSMLLLPGFAWLAARFGAWALLPPAALWLLVQLLHLPPPDLAPDSPPAFNVLAWQALFLLGAWLGRRKLLLGRALPAKAWLDRWLVPPAVAVVVAAFLVRLSGHGLLPLTLPQVGLDAWDKAALAPVPLVHALALALLVARYTPRDAPWMHRALPRLVAAAGRHSLRVFCAGLFVSFGATHVLLQAPGGGAWLEAALILSGSGLLLLFARVLDRPRTAGAVRGSPRLAARLGAWRRRRTGPSPPIPASPPAIGERT